VRKPKNRPAPNRHNSSAGNKTEGNVAVMIAAGTAASRHRVIADQPTRLPAGNRAARESQTSHRQSNHKRRKHRNRQPRVRRPRVRQLPVRAKHQQQPSSQTALLATSQDRVPDAAVVVDADVLPGRIAMPTLRTRLPMATLHKPNLMQMVTSKQRRVAITISQRILAIQVHNQSDRKAVRQRRLQTRRLQKTQHQHQRRLNQ
jgi:hypothetical protein